MLKCSKGKEELADRLLYVPTWEQLRQTRKVFIKPHCDKSGRVVRPRGRPINYQGTNNLWRDAKVEYKIWLYLALQNKVDEYGTST